MNENASRKNNSDDYVVEQSSGLQIDNLSKVSGKELFRDSQYLVNVLHLRTGIYFRNSFVVGVVCCQNQKTVCVPDRKSVV